MAPPSLSDSSPGFRAAIAARIFACFALSIAAFAGAQDMSPLSRDAARYVADIELQTAEEVLDLLERSEQLLSEGAPLPQQGAQVTFVLHGPVLESFRRDNYLDNKRLVDLAASLSALAVIEVKACNTWMRSNGLEPALLQPFVEPVSYGPGLVERLIGTENYRHF